LKRSATNYFEAGVSTPFSNPDESKRRAEGDQGKTSSKETKEIKGRKGKASNQKPREAEDLQEDIANYL